jgi:YesN/AraC family two-component response regulator
MLPLKYINMKKIEKAQILLLTTNLTQNEICDETGFNNLPYFYRVFQKQTGSTPARYRRMGGLV